jgi:hypothetical protein
VSPCRLYTYISVDATRVCTLLAAAKQRKVSDRKAAAQEETATALCTTLLLQNKKIWAQLATNNREASVLSFLFEALLILFISASRFGLFVNTKKHLGRQKESELGDIF